MQRVAPWLAVIFAAAIAVVAVFEIDFRSDEGELAQPTTVPSPTEPTTMTPSAYPAPSEPPAATATTAGPPTPDVTPEPTLSTTVAPTLAPTTAPPITWPTPIPTDMDPMPHTGGGAVGGGAAITLIAAALGLLLRYSKPRRS